MSKLEKLENLINVQGSEKQGLNKEREELAALLDKLSKKPFLGADPQLQTLKEQLAKKHRELMETFKREEKLSREIQKSNS